MSEQGRKVVIVGAGPAGLMAALHAAKEGANVTVLEHSKHACLKLGITGKGRCNVTNARPMAEFREKVPQGFDFLQPAFAYYSNVALRSELERMGVPTLVERGDRVYPSNGDAQTVRRALIGAAQGAGVLLLATGGCSYPATGSDGSGYSLARALGHTVTPLRPTLVGLRVANALTAAAGEELRNVRVALLRKGECLAEEQGEVMCERLGFGGSAVLRLSRLVTMAEERDGFSLSIDFKPGLNRAKLRGRIAREREERPREPLSSSLRALLPAKLVLPVGRRAGVPLNRGWADLRAHDVECLVQTLKGMRFDVVGHEGFERALVTAGGVALDEVHPETMESRLVPNLYFAGELLDVDANTGGFNLQIAFSTGALAGSHLGRG